MVSPIENLEKFENLEELYLGSNYFTTLDNNSFNNDLVGKSLSILDISNNKQLLKLDKNLENLKELTDLWLNSCGLNDWKDLDSGLSPIKDNLDVIYLEHNPLQVDDANYRRKVKMICPNLSQIDATGCQGI